MQRAFIQLHRTSYIVHRTSYIVHRTSYIVLIYWYPWFCGKIFLLLIFSTSASGTGKMRR